MHVGCILNSYGSLTYFSPPSSTLMDTEIINGTKIYSSNLQFPYQAKPSKADFSFWNDCIHQCFCKYVTPADSTRAEIHIVHWLGLNVRRLL
jgi:hypothetical protein